MKTPKVTAIATLISLLFVAATAVAETTSAPLVESSSPVPDVQTCGTLKTTSQARIHIQARGQKSRHHYPSNKLLNIARISGDWAMVEWPSGSGWIHKSKFDGAKFDSAKQRCISGIANQHLYPTRGSIGSSGSLDTAIAAQTSTSIRDNGLTDQYKMLRRFYAEKNRKERYVFINKLTRDRSKFTTYVVDMKTSQVKASFDSLRGYGGIGCGGSQTRPGIFRLHSTSGTGASRKPWWGNNFKYQVMQNIGGHSKKWGGQGCGLNSQIVAHSNKNMRGRSSRGRRFSAGCFVTSPEIFKEWTEKVAGDALIYNVK